MYKSWRISVLGIVIAVCLFCGPICILNAQAPNHVEASEQPVEIIVPKPEIELQEKPVEQAKQNDLSTTIKPPVERPVVEQPQSDIIKVNVRLYNDHSTGFNPVDGNAYIYDIAAMLHKHAPEGMRISAGCAMAYTEGGSGKQGVYAATNNCFGIRATSKWEGWVYARNQGRVYKDYQTAVRNGGADFFCAYPTMEESVMHYVRLISGDYYNKAFTYDNDRDYLNYILSKGYGEESLLNVWLSLINMYDTTKYNF